jgi:hypothetical protein
VHLAVALSFFRASRCPSEATPTTKLSPPATFPEFVIHQSRKSGRISALRAGSNRVRNGDQRTFKTARTIPAVEAGTAERLAAMPSLPTASSRSTAASRSRTSRRSSMNAGTSYKWSTSRKSRRVRRAAQGHHQERQGRRWTDRRDSQDQAVGQDARPRGPREALRAGHGASGSERLGQALRATEARAHRRADRVDMTYGCGMNASMTCAKLKLAGFWRIGNSLKLSSHFAATAWTGTSRKTCAAHARRAGLR